MKIEKDLEMISSFDGTKIHYDIYEPEGNDTGILVQALHGMCEHKGRYQALGEYLASRGITFIISAHRGHEGGVASPKDYGHMGKDGLHGAREDAHQLTSILKERYPNKTFILFGHSMGSLIARLYFRNYNDELDGLIICGSPQEANKPTIAAGKFAASFVRFFKGASYHSKVLDSLCFGANNKNTAKRTPFDWLSVSEENVDNYINDPACGFIFSTQSFYDLVDGTREVYSPYPKPIKNPNCPVYFIAGKEDPCGGYGEGVIKAMEHMKSQGFENVDIKIYNNMRHEILNESNWEVVASDIMNFCLKVKNSK